MIWVSRGWGDANIKYHCYAKWKSYCGSVVLRTTTDMNNIVGWPPYDCQSKKKMLKHIIYIWSRSAMSIKWVGSPTHNLTACIEHNLLLLLVLSLSWADISVGLHPYDWQPKQKMLKHIIYIWSRSAMSIKWVGSPNLNLTAWIQHNLLLLLMLVLSLS